jgi:hypothetical protein
MAVPEGQVFRADFSQSFGVEHCFLVEKVKAQVGGSFA